MFHRIGSWSRRILSSLLGSLLVVLRSVSLLVKFSRNFIKRCFNKIFKINGCIQLQQKLIAAKTTFVESGITLQEIIYRVALVERNLWSTAVKTSASASASMSRRRFRRVSLKQFRFCNLQLQAKLFEVWVNFGCTEKLDSSS